MKIGYLTSLPDQKCHIATYRQTVNLLEKKGHTVIHTLDISSDEFSKKSSEEKKDIYNAHYARLKQADIIFADVSCTCMDIMYGISLLITHLKPVVILYEKGIEFHPKIEDVFGVDNQQVIIQSYSQETLHNILSVSLNFVESKVDKRFHILLPARLMDKLDEITKIKKIAKAVYIRQLLEMNLL